MEDFRNVLPIKGAYSVRNFIAHDYDGIDLPALTEVIKLDLPKLKVTLQTLLQ